MEPQSDDKILDVKDLKMYFPITSGLLRRKIADVKAVDGVTFHLKKGETLGLVGESGCGKTTVGRCIIRLYEPSSGQIVFNGEDITSLSERKMQHLRRKMAFIFQDPYSSLDPRQNAASIVGEPLRVQHMVHSKVKYDTRVEDLFRLVGLDPSMMNRFPHEFSGGQRQRIGIARALASKPSLIICDEPVSALDVSMQAQIINLLKELKEEFSEKLAYIFIAHDLSVVRHISDRVVVMYLGHIMEINQAKELYKNPLHPYTKVLLSAVPIADPFVEEKREHIILPGEVPSSLNPPSGCVFHTRCPEAIPECSQTVPKLVDKGDGHEVACIRR